MNWLHNKIEHPWTAFCVYFVIGALLARYGIVEGTALIFCLFAGIIIYKFVTS